MDKRGQITAFIVVGIIILICAGIFISISGKVAEEEMEVEKIVLQDIDFIANIVDNLVISCLKNTLNEALLENSFSGGYFILPEESTKNITYNVPLYYKNGQNMVPDDDILVYEIQLYVDALLDLCLDDFRSLDSKGYNIDIDRPSSTVMLDPDKLFIETSLPITITSGTTKKRLSRYSTEIPARKFYNNIVLARGLVSWQSEDGICLSCFSDYAYENNLTIDILPTIDNTYVLDITDENYLIDGENFRLRFAMKYNEDQ